MANSPLPSITPSFSESEYFGALVRRQRLLITTKLAQRLSISPKTVNAGVKCNSVRRDKCGRLTTSAYRTNWE